MGLLYVIKEKMLSTTTTTNRTTTFVVDSSSSLLQKDLRRRCRFLLPQTRLERIGRGRERQQQLQQTFKMNSKNSSSTAACCCSLSSPSSSSRSMFATTRTTTTLNKRMVVVQTKAGGGGTSLVPVSDRVVAFLPYLLPLISGLRYSRYFFAAFPAAIIMLQPLLPIVKIVATLPLGNLIPFFALFRRGEELKLEQVLSL